MAISEDKKNLGKFFGEIEGAIFEVLENNNLFKRVEIFDYQAVCMESSEQNHDDDSRRDEERVKKNEQTNEPRAKQCDKEISLFELDESFFSSQTSSGYLEGILRNCQESECER